MSRTDLQRTARRGVAVLLVPLSLLLVQVQVVTEQLPGVVDSSLPGLSNAIGTVLLVVSVLYLLVSGLGQLSAAADTPF